MANNRLYLKAPNGDLFMLAKSMGRGWRLQCTADEFAAWADAHPDPGVAEGVVTQYRLDDDNAGAPDTRPLLDVLRGLTPQQAATLGEMLDDKTMNAALLRDALGNAEHRYYVSGEGWVDSARIVEIADEIGRRD